MRMGRVSAEADCEILHKASSRKRDEPAATAISGSGRTCLRHERTLRASSPQDRDSFLNRTTSHQALDLPRLIGAIEFNEQSASCHA